jgi:hypothetical protein
MTKTKPLLTEIDSIAAYVKGNPIRTPVEMPLELGWNLIDDEWRKNLEERNPFWLTTFRGNLEDQLPYPHRNSGTAHLERILFLRDKLLSFGGEESCMPPIEEDIEKILSRGQLWYGDRILLMKGRRSHCHSNSALLWNENKENTHIATGYALTKDGMWRQHTWLIHIRPRKNQVVETTVRRIAYFGFVMTDDECKELLDNS